MTAPTNTTESSATLGTRGRSRHAFPSTRCTACSLDVFIRSHESARGGRAAFRRGSRATRAHSGKSRDAGTIENHGIAVRGAAAFDAGRARARAPSRGQRVAFFSRGIGRVHIG